MSHWLTDVGIVGMDARNQEEDMSAKIGNPSPRHRRLE